MIVGWFFGLWFLATLLGAEESSSLAEIFHHQPSLTTLDSEPSVLIGGCIHAATGAFIDDEVDMVVVGPEPVPLHRIYQSSDHEVHTLGVGWKTDYDTQVVKKNVGDDGYYITYEGSDYHVEFGKWTKPNGSPYLRLEESCLKNSSNSQGALGAIYNIQASGFKRSRGTMQFPDGSRKHFHDPDTSKIYHHWCTEQLNGLQWMQEPRTLFLGFYKDTIPLAYLSGRQEELITTLEGVDGQRTLYHFHKKGSRKYLVEVERPALPSVSYQWDLDHKRIVGKSYPEGRSWQIKYYSHTEYSRKKGAVHTVTNPLGVVLYNCFYFDHKTEVYQPGQYTTKYYFDKAYRLSKKSQLGEGERYTEALTWGDQGSLCARRFYREVGSKQETLFQRYYLRDKWGNITEDRLEGALTGYSQQETRVHQYVYSQEGYNLLRFSREGNLVKEYVYYPSTNLVAACYEYDPDRMVRRHFYRYDPYAMLIEQIDDDGCLREQGALTGVTFRKIVRITRSAPQGEIPAGLPLITEELALDLTTGEELLVFRKERRFDRLGQPLQESTWGSDGAFAHTELWGYDSWGNQIYHQDVVGDETHRGFDANKNLLWEETGSLRTSYTYNAANLCIAKIEEHPDGPLVTRYGYDARGNKTLLIDSTGHETRFTYDAFGRCIETTTPAWQGKSPKTRVYYDPLGHPIKIVDPLGHLTRMRYTLLDKVCYIQTPDGAEEWFFYNHEGQLVEKREKNGTAARYTRDAWGRTTRTDFFDTQGAYLYSSSASYSGYFVLTETNPEGVTTFYRYNARGQLVEQQCDDKLITFRYDPLGRVAVKQTQSITDPLEGGSEVKSYDAKGRVVEERMESLEGKVLTCQTYVYDRFDNRIVVATKTPTGWAITTSTFDTHQMATEVVDPLGHKTVMERFFVPCETGLQLCLRTIRADGRQLEQLHNSQGWLIAEITKDLLGNKLHERQLSYDLCGNRIGIEEHTYLPDGKEEVYTTRFSFDAMKREIEMVRGYKTAQQRTTSHRYNRYGEKSATQKPDGVVLQYTYNRAGYLERLFSSDGSVDYRYRYNRLGLWTELEDAVAHARSYRTFDALGRLTQEQQLNGQVVSFRHTVYDKLRALLLPDGTTVDYSYEGPFLTQVHSRGYTHTYSRQAGLITGMELPTGQQVSYSYTERNELASIEAPSYTLRCRYDATGRMVARSVEGDAQLFDYDALDQLTAEPGFSYSYDSLAHRRSKNGRAYQLDSLGQLTFDGVIHYQYDLAGRLTQEGERRYRYDALDRLIDLDGLSLTYDGENRCMAVGDLQLLFAGQSEVAAFEQSRRVELRVLGVGQQSDIGAAVQIELEGVTYFPLHDPTGHLVRLLDTEGSCVAAYNYGAFEELSTENTILAPWRFASKRQVAHLVLFGYRLYHPTIGRWLTLDPVGLTAGPNLYTYLKNNPLTQVDPYGLSGSFLKKLPWQRIACITLAVAGLYFIPGLTPALRAAAGGGLECIAHHAIPGPYHLGPERLGSVIAGRPHDPSYNHAPSQTVFYGGIANFIQGQRPHSQVNIYGVNTSFEDAQQQSEDMARIYGCKVYSVAYNSTWGLATDIIEVLLQKFGVPTHSASVALKTVRTSLQEVGETGIVHIVCHSQGVQICQNVLSNLTPQERARVVVSAFGGATFIDDTGLAGALNYVSTRDPIPFLGDFFHFTKAILASSPKVVVLPSRSSSIFDHSIMGDTYVDGMKQDAADFKNDYL